MNIEKKMQDLIQSINSEIKKISKNHQRDESNSNRIIKEALNKSFEQVMSPGKRIRGILVIQSFQIFKPKLWQKNRDDVIKIAAAIEIIHSYLLVHDDIMDMADERRGVPTIHEQYKSKFESQNADIAARFGESMAICSGDLLFSIANTILLNTKLPDSLKISILKKIHRKIEDVIYGQVLDIYGMYQNPDEEIIYKIYELKTGRYTYELPLLIASEDSETDSKKVAAISNYSIKSGIAYQVVDDIIGSFGIESQTGKSVTSDITEGKATILNVIAFSKVDHKKKLILESTLGNPDSNEKMIKAVKKIYVDTGAFDKAETKAQKLIEEANEEIKKVFNKDNENLSFLVELNKKILSRTK